MASSTTPTPSTTAEAIVTTVATTLANATTDAVINATSTLTTIVANMTSTVAPSTSTAVPATTTTASTSITTLLTSTSTAATTTAVFVPSSTSPSGEESGGHSPFLFFVSTILFISAIMLIAKIVLSNRKKRAQLIGSARWRMSGGGGSAAVPLGGGAYPGGGRTEAAYLPMDSREIRSNFDNPTTANRLDWERQFFDDSEPTDDEPVPPSRLRLEVRDHDGYP